MRSSGSPFFPLYRAQGPFLAQADGTLAPNPLSWNKFATMVYFEQPVGVGFSYSSAPADYQNLNDAVSASDNAQFLTAFFAAHPQYASQPLFLTSESYGGNYVPQMTRAVLEGGDARLQAQLKEAEAIVAYTSMEDKAAAAREASAAGVAVHKGVACQCCHAKPLRGVRFKCREGPCSSDLCGACVARAAAASAAANRLGLGCRAAHALQFRGGGDAWACAKCARPSKGRDERENSPLFVRYGCSRARCKGVDFCASCVEGLVAGGGDAAAGGGAAGAGDDGGDDEEQAAECARGHEFERLEEPEK